LAPTVLSTTSKGIFVTHCSLFSQTSSPALQKNSKL
jgi:hypothetical protein